MELTESPIHPAIDRKRFDYLVLFSQNLFFNPSLCKELLHRYSVCSLVCVVLFLTCILANNGFAFCFCYWTAITTIYPTQIRITIISKNDNFPALCAICWFIRGRIFKSRKIVFISTIPNIHL